MDQQRQPLVNNIIIYLQISFVYIIQWIKHNMCPWLMFIVSLRSLIRGSNHHSRLSICPKRQFKQWWSTVLCCLSFLNLRMSNFFLPMSPKRSSNHLTQKDDMHEKLIFWIGQAHRRWRVKPFNIIPAILSWYLDIQWQHIL